LQQTEQAAFEFRDGVVLYTIAATMQPVQLTLVSYRELEQFPVIHFDGWDTLSKSDKALLAPMLKSPAISAFLRIDPQTGDGHIAGANLLEVLPVAA